MGLTSNPRPRLVAGAILLLASIPLRAELTELAAVPLALRDFTDEYCYTCHNDVDLSGRFDIESLPFDLSDPAAFRQWVKVFDRVDAGEMPPKRKARPDSDAQAAFMTGLQRVLATYDQARIARDGRAVQRRLNAYEYENAVRDLLDAPWLQIRGQFPEDGESHRYNKIGNALDVSHVHLSRYMAAADYALREILSAQVNRPPATTTRHYARDQATLTTKVMLPRLRNNSPDRSTFPVLDTTIAQTDVRLGRAPLTVGDADPATREREGVGMVASNYVTGFTYRWDAFKAPVAGKYRIRFNGFTAHVAPGGAPAFPADHEGPARKPSPRFGDYDRISAGRRNEPVSVYTVGGIANRRVGTFDLTPEPAAHDLGEVWLLAGETLVPDATRLFRSRPGWELNPLMTEEGAPAVVFRWMEITGPLDDDDQATLPGYHTLFGDLPLLVRTDSDADHGITLPATGGNRNRDRATVVEVVSTSPRRDAERLLRAFLDRAYRRPVTAADVQRFLALYDDRIARGRNFGEALLVAYTAVLASPGFVFLQEEPGPLDDYALATRLALFLWNSPPDDTLRAHAARRDLSRPDILRAETERLLAHPKASRFRDAFLDYWVDLRKVHDSTPSTLLYNDYYLDDALQEAAIDETRLTFDELIRENHPARTIVDADFIYANERLAKHYGIPGVEGVAMRRVTLPTDSPRGGFLTQASVLKITANGTTTSPVLRGKWILERILGIEIPPPPPVAAVEPDIRGAVTIRQQLAQHRDDASCASCHNKMDPPGFALESFDVMGGWRDRYRAANETSPPEPGFGKNGLPFTFHHGLPVDAAGELPDGRPFTDIREFKRLAREDDRLLARNLIGQFLVYATGAPLHFSDRPEIEAMLDRARPSNYGARTLIHEIVQSRLFRAK